MSYDNWKTSGPETGGRCTRCGNEDELKDGMCINCEQELEKIEGQKTLFDEEQDRADYERDQQEERDRGE